MIAKLPASESVERDQLEARQVLTFVLNGHSYGLELTRVQEIRGLTQITPIPNMPAHIKGVMNLRGSVLPVIDMRLKFGMEPVEYTKFTVILIAHSRGKSVGLVVDAVSDVLAAAVENIQAAPGFGETARTRFVQGLIKHGDKLIVLLDLDSLLVESEVSGNVMIPGRTGTQPDVLELESPRDANQS